MEKKELIPGYAWLPVLSVIGVNLIVYYVTGHVIDDSVRHGIYMEIDTRIPFVPFFVVFYVLAYLQWALGWYMAARDGRRICFKYCKADIIAKAICLVCFIAYPTIIERPVLEVHDVFTWALSVIYRVDTPAVNCLPSIHVLASWIAMRAGFELERAGTAYRCFGVFCCAACMASVVLVKQHYFIDIPAGILAAEIGIAVSRRLNNERFLWIS